MITKVDYLFDDILSAPTADEHKLAMEANIGNSGIRNVGRRVSQAARRMSAAVGSAASNAVQAVSIRKRTTLSLVLDETTRVVPEEVVHLHALARNALGQSLLEAFTQRESEASLTSPTQGRV
jgi:hypothetical protein